MERHGDQYCGFDPKKEVKLVRSCCQKRCTVHTKRNFLGKDPRARPPKRWADQIRQEKNLPLRTIQRTATDRERWKKCVSKKYAKIWRKYENKSYLLRELSASRSKLQTPFWFSKRGKFETYYSKRFAVFTAAQNDTEYFWI